MDAGVRGCMRLQMRLSPRASRSRGQGFDARVEAVGRTIDVRGDDADRPATLPSVPGSMTAHPLVQPSMPTATCRLYNAVLLWTGKGIRVVDWFVASQTPALLSAATGQCSIDYGLEIEPSFGDKPSRDIRRSNVGLDL
jgi:hypothetical protein